MASKSRLVFTDRQEARGLRRERDTMRQLAATVGVKQTTIDSYGTNWKRRAGGYPASNSQSFKRGTETSLQSF